MVARYRLDIAYDGRDFAGWARQRNLRTVQGELERVLSMLLHRDVDINCAGRTDAGVHARGQVTHVDLDRWPPDIDAHRINRALPPDVRITRLTLAPVGFDARFSAIWRRYGYSICDDPDGPDPLLRHLQLPWYRHLDCNLMNDAARGLLGEHDFTAYCKQRDGASSVRKILDLHWERTQSVVTMQITADAFCHSMVRSIVGAFLPVGDGRKPVTWPSSMLVSGVRGAAVMPGYPLILEEVGYPADEHLLERQQVTRNFRELTGETTRPTR